MGKVDKRHEMFREVARDKLHAVGATVSEHAHVHQTHGGAFVEAEIWVEDRRVDELDRRTKEAMKVIEEHDHGSA